MSAVPVQYHAIVLRFVKTMKVLHARGIVLKSNELVNMLTKKSSGLQELVLEFG